MNHHPDDPIFEINEMLGQTMAWHFRVLRATIKWCTAAGLFLILGALLIGFSRLSRSAQVVEIQQSAITRNRDAIEAMRVDRLVRQQQYESLKAEIRDVGIAVTRLQARK